MEFEYPYILPLVSFLNEDVDIKKYFPNKNYLKIGDNIKFEDIIKSNSKNYRDLCIIPMSKTPIYQNETEASCSHYLHQFFIAVVIPCLVDEFTVGKNSDGALELRGPFYSASSLRCLILDKVKCWGQNIDEALKYGPNGFYDMRIVDIPRIQKYMQDCGTFIVAGALIEIKLNN